MATLPLESVDPRIRRTRQLLQQALDKLLQEKEFDRISIQEIADAATVNRVTFYDHYQDKFALLDELVAARFHALLTRRNVTFDCSSALSSIVLAVRDFLTSSPGTSSPTQTRMESHLESAVIRVVRALLLDGIRKHPPAGNVPPEMLAATVSWAIYGAVKEWLRSPGRCPSGQVVDTVVQLVSPLLHPPAAQPVASPD